MRFIIFLSCSLSVISAKGQSITDQIMSKATCSCITNVVKPQSDSTSLYECFMRNIGNDTVLIKKECLRIYGDTSGRSFYKLGNDFFERNSESLIFTCDDYFKLIDSTRYSQLDGLDKNTLHNTLKSLNTIDTKDQDNAFHIKRGMTYFGLQDYDNALIDFNSSLSVDSNRIEILFFKAWVLENQKKYDEAIKIYTNLASLANQKEFRIFAAIAKRKKNNL